MDLQTKIENDYSWFVDKYHVDPNCAIVKIKWYDEDEPEDEDKTIIIDKKADNEKGLDYVNDDDILYYCHNINEFIELTKTDQISDFKVVDVISLGNY